jgi:hypothetical protein
MSQISVKNDIDIHVDYVELMVQVMKTSLEPQRHGTSKEVKILSCMLKLKSVIYNHHLRLQYTLQFATHINYNKISILTKCIQHNQLQFFQELFALLCTSTPKLKPYTYSVCVGSVLICNRSLIN